MSGNMNYEQLANAIIIQAVKDWKVAVRSLKKQPRYYPAKAMKSECEQFFNSQWLEGLTGVEGKYLLMKLEGEERGNDKQGIL